MVEGKYGLTTWWLNGLLGMLYALGFRILGLGMVWGLSLGFGVQFWTGFNFGVRVLILPVHDFQAPLFDVIGL